MIESSDIKVSIIVPMYNVESYLPECVESLRNQVLKDIEVILVDDGSPDNSGQLAEAYAAMDGRIHVVHRENGGLGPARNTGLDHAKGDYVGFVDSDDWVDPDMYQRLYEKAQETDADAVYTGIKTIEQGKTGVVIPHPFAGKTLSSTSEIFELRKSYFGTAPTREAIDSVPVSACIAIYKRAFLEEHHLRFINVQSEDVFFNTAVCRNARKVACIAGAPYCYRKDDQPSITNGFNPVKIQWLARFFELLAQLVREEPEEFQEECRLRANRCMIDCSRALMKVIERADCSDADKNRYVKELCFHALVRDACRDYPFAKLPPMQMVFGVCLKHGLISVCRFLVRIRG